MDISWRSLTADDVPAWERLLAAAEAVDHTGEHYDAEDLVEELADPLAGPDDRIGGFYGDRLVVFAGLRPRGTVTDHWRIDAEGTVDPAYRGRGLGQRGLDWVVGRCAELQHERHPDVETRIQVTGFLGRDDQVSLLEGAGFVQVHWSAVMRARLADLPTHADPVAWPEGLSLHTYDRSFTGATMAAHNTAFLDHWGFVPWTAEMWEQWVDGTKNSRHDLSWVVVDDSRVTDDVERVVGYLLTSEFEAYQRATGRREAYLAKLGVRRERRGLGVASGLLRHALAAYRAEGFDESSLDVDTNNPTGAFGLYERAGFVVETRTATFQRLLGAR